MPTVHHRPDTPLEPIMTHRQTATYTASSSSARAGFLGLAAIVTFALLTSLSHVADRQVEDVLLAQTGQATMAQAPASAARHGA
jgi:hypothetical protein